MTTILWPSSLHDHKLLNITKNTLYLRNEKKRTKKKTIIRFPINLFQYVPSRK